MVRLDRFKQLADTTTGKLQGPALESAAEQVVVKTSQALDTAQSIARRAGLTKRNGEFSKVRAARKVLLAPGKTARSLLDATAQEIQSRRKARSEETE